MPVSCWKRFCSFSSGVSGFWPLVWSGFLSPSGFCPACWSCLSCPWPFLSLSWSDFDLSLLLLLLLFLLLERAQGGFEVAQGVLVVGGYAQRVPIGVDRALVVLLLEERVAEVVAGRGRERRACVLGERAVEGRGLGELAVLVEAVRQVEAGGGVGGAQGGRALERLQGRGMVAPLVVGPSLGRQPTRPQQNLVEQARLRSGGGRRVAGLAARRGGGCGSGALGRRGLREGVARGEERHRQHGRDPRGARAPCRAKARAEGRGAPRRSPKGPRRAAPGTAPCAGTRTPGPGSSAPFPRWPRPGPKGSCPRR